FFSADNQRTPVLMAKTDVISALNAAPQSDDHVINLFNNIASRIATEPTKQYIHVFFVGSLDWGAHGLLDTNQNYLEQLRRDSLRVSLYDIALRDHPGSTDSLAIKWQSTWQREGIN